MNFKTHNENIVNIPETNLVGYIGSSYSDITKLFGDPFPLDNYPAQIRCRWNVFFEDGSFFTIYCKSFYTKGENIKEVEKWHIGGTKNNNDKLLNDVLTENMTINWRNGNT